MSRYRLTAEAQADVRILAQRIRRDSPRAAIRLANEVRASARRLGEFPGLGHRRQDLTPLPLRFWTIWGRYMMVYREEPGLVVVVRVVDGYSDVARTLGGRVR